MEKKCAERINVLRICENKSWGLSQRTLTVLPPIFHLETTKNTEPTLFVATGSGHSIEQEWSTRLEEIAWKRRRMIWDLAKKNPERGTNIIQ